MQSYKINGDSMLPLFHNGEMVVAVETKQDQLKKYDLIIFKQGDRLICHYIWEISKSIDSEQNMIFQTRPLNPIWDFDPPFPADKIVAKVVGRKISIFRKAFIQMATLLVRKTG